MLIVRGTQALRAKLPATVPLSDPDAATGVLGAWYGSLLRWRSPVVLLLNEASLLPVLLPLAPARTLLTRIPDAVAAVLAAIDVPAPVIEAELASWGDGVRVGPTASRSLTGVMVDYGKHADWWRGPEERPDLLTLAVRLAAVPVKPLWDRHGFPDRETRAALGLPVPAPRGRPGSPTTTTTTTPPTNSTLGSAGSPPDPTAWPGPRAAVPAPPRRAGSSTGRESAFGRLRSPEAPAGPVRVEYRPGSGAGLMAELIPLLAAEGIDMDDPPEQDVLQAALDRAIEARNHALFTPTGTRRHHAITVLIGIASALHAGDEQRAGELLEQVVPESPDDTAPEVSAVMGSTLTLLDDWLTGHTPHAPAGLGPAVRLPTGHRTGGRAAVEILALARRGRASSSLGALIVGQGSVQTLHGAVLVAHAALTAWAARTGRPFDLVIADAIR